MQQFISKKVCVQPVEHVLISGGALFFLLIAVPARAHDTISLKQKDSLSSFLNINQEKIFKPLVVLELWATYSKGEKKDDMEYANRTDVFLRRFRLGASGKPYPWLSYCFQLHIDRIGEDYYSATKGNYAGIDLWNAYITIKLLKESELLNLHAGHFWAAISREYNTSPWAVGSFDKTRSVWYTRSFVTGTGNGIESGIGIGGLKNFEHVGISYRVGTYEPEKYASSMYSNRLYTARVMIMLGEPEQPSYQYMLSGNQWRKHNGITIGFGGSSQANGKLSDTTFFTRSKAYGADILINYKGFRIDGEYFILRRQAAGLNHFSGNQWHLRAGYCFILGNKYIEPVISYEYYDGNGPGSLFKYIGSDITLDAGINWYLNKEKLKISAHYLIQTGNVSSNVGDFLGISLQLKI